MKLRNKKTGEIMQLSVKCENGGELKTFDLNINTDKPITLAELNEEWEDYEEPKEYWYMDYAGFIHSAARTGNSWEVQKKIGNCFETKEEAEKAIEKLKAWKRLKDKGFRFEGWEMDGTIWFETKQDEQEWSPKYRDDLDLLFRGEE